MDSRGDLNRELNAWDKASDEVMTDPQSEREKLIVRLMSGLYGLSHSSASAVADFILQRERALLEKYLPREHYQDSMIERDEVIEKAYAALGEIEAVLKMFSKGHEDLAIIAKHKETK
jgi:hypothetical protein